MIYNVLQVHKRKRLDVTFSSRHVTLKLSVNIFYKYLVLEMYLTLSRTAWEKDNIYIYIKDLVFRKNDVNKYNKCVSKSFLIFYFFCYWCIFFIKSKHRKSVKLCWVSLLTFVRNNELLSKPGHKICPKAKEHVVTHALCNILMNECWYLMPQHSFFLSLTHQQLTGSVICYIL